jgi:hypothetical protein
VITRKHKGACAQCVLTKILGKVATFLGKIMARKRGMHGTGPGPVPSVMK